MILVSGVFKVHGGGMRDFLIDMEEGDRESEEKDEGILAVHHKIGSLRSAGSPSLGMLESVSASCVSLPTVNNCEGNTSKLNKSI